MKMLNRQLHFKALGAAAAVALCAGQAVAEGYQVNTLSAKQLGMGHTGIGQELGAESMFFNPGALGLMKNTVDVSGSVTAIMPKATATLEDGSQWSTDCNPSTPLMLNAAFSIYDNLKAGISFYTPYGSSINWTENWPGAVLTQDVNLKVFTVQPTVSWAITPKLSVGVGAMISWGSVDLNKGLVSAATFDAALPLLNQQLAAQLQQQGLPAYAMKPYGNTCPASVNLQGKSKVTVGLNVGVLYKVNDKVNVGASLRSRMPMKVGAGTASVKYADSDARRTLGQTLDMIDQSSFRAQMPCPWVLGVGTSWKPIDKLKLALDARLTGWHTYKQLNVEFLADRLRAFDQHISKHYSNSWCFSLGGEYALTERLDVRAGLMLDTTPVDKNFYNPETPGMTKVEPSCGLSFRPVKGLSIDVAFMYVHGCGAKNTSCTYPDLMGKSVMAQAAPVQIPAIAQQLMSVPGLNLTPDQATAMATQKFVEAMNDMGISQHDKTFKASYKLHALMPSIGVSYTF